MNLKKLLLDENLSKLEGSYLLDFSENKKHYSNSFFEEYKRHPLIQFDSFNKLSLNKDRFYNNSKWKKEDLDGKYLLEVGSGAGKFTEILLQTKANIVTIDSSDSIKINHKNNFKRNINNVYFIKTNANENIFKNNVFDFVVLYGVLQNVDNQKKIIQNCVSYLKKGGKLTLDVTKAKDFYLHLINPKYFWRNLTKHMSPRKLYSLVNFYIPKFIRIDTFLKKKFGFLGRFLSKIIFPFPLINYYFLPLKNEIKLEMSILDTFDALASKFDKPITKNDLKLLIEEIESEQKIKFKKIEIFEKENLIIANIFN